MASLEFQERRINELLNQLRTGGLYVGGSGLIIRVSEEIVADAYTKNKDNKKTKKEKITQSS